MRLPILQVVISPLLAAGCGGQVTSDAASQMNGTPNTGGAVNISVGSSTVTSPPATGGTSSVGSQSSLAQCSGLDLSTAPAEDPTGRTCAGVGIEDGPPPGCSINVPVSSTGMLLVPEATLVVLYPFNSQAVWYPQATSATDCSAKGGWYYDNPTAPTVLTLCPCTCAAANQASIEISFACRAHPTII